MPEVRLRESKDIGIKSEKLEELIPVMKDSRFVKDR
jgi:hypothetical protein